MALRRTSRSSRGKTARSASASAVKRKSKSKSKSKSRSRSRPVSTAVAERKSRSSSTRRKSKSKSRSQPRSRSRSGSRRRSSTSVLIPHQTFRGEYPAEHLFPTFGYLKRQNEQGQFVLESTPRPLVEIAAILQDPAKRTAFRAIGLEREDSVSCALYKTNVTRQQLVHILTAAHETRPDLHVVPPLRLAQLPKTRLCTMAREIMKENFLELVEDVTRWRDSVVSIPTPDLVVLSRMLNVPLPGVFGGGAGDMGKLPVLSRVQKLTFADDLLAKLAESSPTGLAYGWQWTKHKTRKAWQWLRSLYEKYPTQVIAGAVVLLAIGVCIAQPTSAACLSSYFSQSTAVPGGSTSVSALPALPALPAPLSTGELAQVQRILHPLSTAIPTTLPAVSTAIPTILPLSGSTVSVAPVFDASSPAPPVVASALTTTSAIKPSTTSGAAAVVSEIRERFSPAIPPLQPVVGLEDTILNLQRQLEHAQVVTEAARRTARTHLGRLRLREAKVRTFEIQSQLDSALALVGAPPEAPFWL